MARQTASRKLKFKNKTEKRKLGKRVLDALPVPPLEASGKPGRRYVYDADTPRLAICVFTSGAKTWFWVGRISGRPARIKIGDYPEVTPENAKKAAAKISGDNLQGIDPRHAKRKAKLELTLREAFETYMTDYAKPHKKSWQADEALFNRYLKPMGARRLCDITQGEVQAIHTRIGRDHGRYGANRMLSLLSTIFGKVQPKADNPCSGVRRFAEESRERFLDGDELQRFFEALEAETDLWRDYFTLALLTGARRANMMEMRWQELDLVNAIWRIPGPKFKNGRDQTIPLPTEAVDILKQRKLAAEGEFVFPGRNREGSGHVEFPYKSWDRICTRANLKGVRPHDLRRTLGSWQAATGASLPIIGKTLGHLDNRTTAIYTRLNIDPVRAAVTTAVGAMLTAAGKPTEPKEEKAGES